MTSVLYAPAGEGISLTCTASVIPHLVVDPDLQWQGPEGFTALPPVRSDLVFTRELVISSLRTSQAGLYSCEATISIPQTSVQASNSISTEVQVIGKQQLVGMAAGSVSLCCPQLLLLS